MSSASNMDRYKQLVKDVNDFGLSLSRLSGRLDSVTTDIKTRFKISPGEYLTELKKLKKEIPVLEKKIGAELDKLEKDLDSAKEVLADAQT